MACVSLSSITLNKCQTSLGGILTAWIIDRDDLTITKSVDSSQNETGEVTLAVASGKSWSAFQFRKQSSSLNTEMTIDDANGIQFATTTLVLNFSRQEVSKRVAVQSLLSNPNLAVVVKDANGEYIFMGVDSPVSATAGAASTGQASTDPNQYSVTLTDICGQLPYFVAETSRPDYTA